MISITTTITTTIITTTISKTIWLIFTDQTSTFRVSSEATHQRHGMSLLG